MAVYGCAAANGGFMETASWKQQAQMGDEPPTLTRTVANFRPGQGRRCEPAAMTSGRTVGKRLAIGWLLN